MSSEIIERVGFDNYDGDFQHVDFIFSTKLHFTTYFEDYFNHKSDHRARYFWNSVLNTIPGVLLPILKNMFWNILHRQNNSSC
jgi:ABC-type glycerol-3-phosphate transport system permease component